MIISDSLAFLGRPGDKIEVADDLNLNLAHLTAAKPLPWGSDSMAEVAKEIEEFKSQISKFEKLHILESGSKLDKVVSAGKTAVVLGLQHTQKDANAEWLRELGIRFTILSYDGCWDDKIDLTDKERDFILSCDDHGIGIDVSHTSNEKAKAILDFAKIAETKIPVIASHTACHAIYPYARNLTDDVLRQIAKQGGIVGINAISFNLDKHDKSLDMYIDHIRHAVCLCEEDYVCIGSDIPYINRLEDEWKAYFEVMKRNLDPDNKKGIEWPDYPVKLNCADKFFVLNEALIKSAGQKDWERIGGILGKNFYRFVKENL